MSRPPSQVWICPDCGQAVPAYELRCRCGHTFDPSDVPVRHETLLRVHLALAAATLLLLALPPPAPLSA